MFFAGLRPSEARGARWEHYDGRTLSVKQSVWRKHTTDPKTASSARPVLVIEPLRELRTKLQQAEGNTVSGPILRGVKLKDSKPRPLDVNMLAKRVIWPALRNPKTYRDLEAKPLEWQGSTH
jgi:integrase